MGGNPVNFVDLDGLQFAVPAPVLPPFATTNGQTNGVSKAPLNLNQLAKELRSFTGAPTGLDILLIVNGVAQGIINEATENNCPDDEESDLGTPGTGRNPDGTRKSPMDQEDQIRGFRDDGGLADDLSKSERNRKNFLRDLKNIPLDELDDFLDDHGV